jgi:restriction endonuclease S subunit
MRKKFKHLNIFERQTIEIHIKKLEKQSSIAKILKRDP